MRRAITFATAFTALLGIAASFEHFLDPEHYNPGFHEYPGIIGLHVASGGLYLTLAMAQFVRPLRARHPRVHRWMGRGALMAGLTAGVTAVVVAVAFPYSGPMEMAVIWPFAALYLFSLVRGYWLARSRRYAEHREWMIRAMAVATSIATMRLIFVPSLIALGASEELARWLSLTSFGVAFVIHSGVAELWIRSTRPQPAVVPEGSPLHA